MEKATYSQRVTGVTTGVVMTLGPAIVSRLRELAFYTTFGAGTTAGVFAVECAPDPDYAGTWHSLGTMTWGAANTIKYVGVAGVHLAIRVRATTPVADGTANIDVVGN